MSDTEPQLRFLAAYDGNPDHPSIDWAARWAVLTGAQLDLMMAIRPTPGTTEPPEPKRAATQELLDTAENLLEDRYPELNIETKIVYRKPVAALVAASSEYTAIVVGTKGTGGWEGLKVGSVSGTLSASSECPVVVVPESTQPHSDDAPIAIGFNGTPEAYDAVRVMLNRAQAMNVGLIILDVRLSEEERLEDDPEPDAGQMKELLADVVSEYPDVEVEYRDKHGDPRDALAEVSETARLTVMTTRGHGGVGGFLLGEVTSGLLQRARGPVNIRTTTRKDSQLGVLPS